MTTETSVVRASPAGNRKGNATIEWLMATVAPRAAVDVQRMVEARAKTSQGRKRLHSSRLNIRMTDSADWTRTFREQLRVTTAARRVLIFSRQGWLHGIRGSL